MTGSAIYTIGHSNQPLAEFLQLVRGNAIETVVDVRSKPYSRFRHFNREALEKSLSRKGIRYVYMGDSLGGHPEDESLYDCGRVVYERISSNAKFRHGIRQLMEMAAGCRLAVMCTEEQPQACHRHPLIARCLDEQGVPVIHIRRHSPSESANESFREQVDAQLPLFEPSGEDRTWRSPKRIRGK